MKKFVIAIALGTLLCSSSALASSDPMTPVHQFVDALNAGDIGKASAAHLPDVSIIDEFPPYHWNSFEAFFKSFVSVKKKYGITEAQVVLSRPSTSFVDNSLAYVVVPNVTNEKIGGKPTVDRGIFTFVVVKTANGWRIAAWAFSEQ